MMKKPPVEIKEIGDELFVMVDGVKIAMRAKRGTGPGGSWIAIEPGWSVLELDDGDALRPEEKYERNDPKPDCDTAVCGDRWDDVEIEDGDDEQENEVGASEDTAEMRSRIRRGRVCV